MNTFKKRIDELGRIVIPKEIRKSYKINNFDELELRTLDDKIIISKSLGLKLYKEKIKKYINLINKVCNFNLIVIENDIIIESTYDNLNRKISVNYNMISNNIQNTLVVGDNEIFGYMYLDKIILDSNLLGYILYINKDKFNDINILKDIKNLMIDLIN